MGIGSRPVEVSCQVCLAGCAGASAIALAAWADDGPAGGGVAPRDRVGRDAAGTRYLRPLGSRVACLGPKTGSSPGP